MSRPLRPGESYTVEMVFDLPADVRNPRLLITDAGLVNHWLIGHEKSWLHKKVTFLLEAGGSATGRQEPEGR